MELSTQQRTIKSRITIEKHKILLFISFLFTGTFTWSKTSDNLSRIDKSNKFCETNSCEINFPETIFFKKCLFRNTCR